MTGAGSYLHELRAATNPDEQSDIPRAFWGRTDSSRAQWEAGPANGRGGMAPGAAPGIRAGSRALPVLGGGVRRAGSLLGGLRSNGARVRRKEKESTSNRSDRYRLHGRKGRAGGRGASGSESPPSRSSRCRATSPPPHAAPQSGSRESGRVGPGKPRGQRGGGSQPHCRAPLCPARTMGRCSLWEARSRVASGAAPHPAALPLA